MGVGKHKCSLKALVLNAIQQLDARYVIITELQKVASPKAGSSTTNFAP